MNRLAGGLAIVLAGLAAAAQAQIQIGPPSRDGWRRDTQVAPVPKTPEQLAQEREAKALSDWREQRLKDRLATMGKHREGEARRQVEMEEAARRARGLGFESSNGGSAPPASPVQRVCRDVDDGTHKGWNRAPQRSSAETSVRGSATAMCRQRGGHAGFSMQCKERQETRKVPVDGNPLKFRMVPAGKSWECEATYRCAQPKKVCEGGTGAVRQ